jgi:hypothetical protein
VVGTPNATHEGIHLINGNDSTSEPVVENSQKPLLKYLATASFILARNREVVAAIPKLTAHCAQGVQVLVSPSYDIDEYSLLAARNPLYKKDDKKEYKKACEKDEEELDEVILCTNETLDSSNIDSDIFGYIHDNWYVDKFFAIFR